MNRFILFIFSFLFSSTLFGQTLQITFKEYIYDFGFIRESEGKVFHNFSFVNDNNFTIEIEEIKTACGCMAPYVSKKVFTPGESGIIKIEYDPTGRPGKFIKSIELKISGNNVKQLFYLNIKGNVIEKEILPSYNETWEYAELQIKPFYASIISESDFRFLNNQELQNFINDLTYEIDQNKFATIKLELFQNDNSYSVELSDAIYRTLKKFILNELSRRNYSPNQVGFSDHAFVKTPVLLNDQIALLKISSLTFNNDSISESGYVANAEKELQYYKTLEQTSKKLDSTKINKISGYLYTQKGASTSIDLKNPNYKTFISSSIREVLMNGSINIHIQVAANAKSSDLEMKRKKTIAAVKKIQKQIIKDLNAEGINENKITFSIPSILVYNDSFPVVEKLIVTRLNFLGEENKFSRLDKWLGLNDTMYLYNKKIRDSKIQTRIQDLPTYLQYFSKGEIKLDTSRREFKLWLQAMIEVMNSGTKISFLIESNESATPSSTKLSNSILSLQRANNTLAYLSNLFESKIKSKSLFQFPKVISAVKGLEYDTREFGVQFEQKFQYLKIIPFYDTITEIKTELFPYQVNFKYNFFEFPSKSDLFQVFITRLIEEINYKGYVKLIIEASSSRVPTENFSSNESLSYQRIEELKKQLIEEVIKKGFDPKRIIIIEERALVQGPPFIRGDNKMNPIFHPYQYIKIIPEKTMN